MKEGFSMLLLIIADKKRKESQLPQGMKKCPYCQNLIDKKATKNALVMPFFVSLGYDVFNLDETEKI